MNKLRFLRAKRTDVLVDLQVLSHQLNLRIRVLHQRSQTLLNALHLLTNGTQNPLLQPIELVETSPRSDLTKTDENTTHSLEIERLVTTEDKYESPELNTKRFDGLCLPGSCRTEWSTTELVVQSLGKGEITAISERRLHETVWDTEIFPAVGEGSVRDTNCEAFEGI